MNSDKVGTSCRLAGSEFLIDGTMRVICKCFVITFESFKSSSLEDRSNLFDTIMCKAKLKLKGKRGLHCRSDGMRKLPPCTSSGILQAADNAVCLTVVLCHTTRSRQEKEEF